MARLKFLHVVKYFFQLRGDREDCGDNTAKEKIIVYEHMKQPCMEIGKTFNQVRILLSIVVDRSFYLVAMLHFLSSFGRLLGVRGR